MDPSSAQPRSRQMARLWYTPLFVTLLYVAIALVAEDGFYPFSHFPMYSFVSTSRHYVIVADGDGKPIPVANLTGLTTGMLAKRYRNYAEVEARKLAVRNVDLPDDSVRRICERLFREMRNGARQRRKEMPAKLQWLRCDVSFVDGKLVDKITPIASE